MLARCLQYGAASMLENYSVRRGGTKGSSCTPRTSVPFNPIDVCTLTMRCKEAWQAVSQRLDPRCEPVNMTCPTLAGVQSKLCLGAQLTVGVLLHGSFTWLQHAGKVQLGGFTVKDSGSVSEDFLCTSQRPHADPPVLTRQSLHLSYLLQFSSTLAAKLGLLRQRKLVLLTSLGVSLHTH